MHNWLSHACVFQLFEEFPLDPELVGVGVDVGFYRAGCRVETAHTVCVGGFPERMVFGGEAGDDLLPVGEYAHVVGFGDIGLTGDDGARGDGGVANDCVGVDADVFT